MPKKRRYRLITFKVFYDSDADILEWWQGIEDGERSESLREIIRAYLGLPAKERKQPKLEFPELSEMRRDTHWIKETLKDMPTYLEELVQELAAYLATMPNTGNQQASLAEDDGKSLSHTEAERRAKRMKKATW